MQIPRALSPREMAALTNTSGNIEFAQTHLRLAGADTYWLTRASHAAPNRVQVLPSRPGQTHLISHSHPSGFSGNPSPADFRVLELLGQKTSTVVRPDGTTVRFSVP